MARNHARKRARIQPRRRGTPGAAPGTLVPIPGAPRPVIRAMSFDAETLEEQRLDDISLAARLRDKAGVLWLNVDGVGDADTLRRLGEVFKLHPLALEDALNVHQRAKSESYEGHHFVVMRMAPSGDRDTTEQVALFIGDRWVVTIQERADEVDSFEPVRERIRKNAGLVRKRGADYLAYALIDSIVDHYFPLLERCGEALDELEELAISSPVPATLDKIYATKRELLAYRKAFWPLRDAIASLARDPVSQIRDDTRLYLRDVHDHIVQVLDILETHRELASGLMDVYLSSVSNRMNEVMRVLTVIATIFIPLTFIAGVYGMNFDPHASRWNMPELAWKYGYPAVLAAMGAIALGLLWFFQRRGWLGAPSPASRGTDSGAPPAP